MIEKRLTLLLLIAILFPILGVGGSSYYFAHNSIKSDRINIVGLVARNKHTKLVETLNAQKKRLASFASTIMSECSQSNTNFQVCFDHWGELYSETEGAVSFSITNIKTNSTHTYGINIEDPKSLPLNINQLTNFFKTDENSGYFYTLWGNHVGHKAQVTYPASVLNELFTSPRELGISGETFLTDQNGFFITKAKYNTHQGHHQPITATPMQDCLDGHNTEVLDTDYRQAKIIHGYRYIPEIGGGCIMAHIEQQEAFSELDNFQLKTIIIALFFLGIGLYVATLISKNIVKPIINLTQASRRIMNGEMNVQADVIGHDEISELAVTFNKLSATIDDNQQQLKKSVNEQTIELQWSEHKLTTLLQNTHDCIISIDEHGTMKFFNKAAEDTFGYKSEEVIGKNVSLLMPKNHQKNHNSYIKQYIDTGEKRVINIERELIGKRKDGTEFQMSLSVSETRLDARLLFVGSITDITSRKEKENQLALFANAFASSKEPMCILDINLKIIQKNQAFDNVFVYDSHGNNVAISQLFLPSTKNPWSRVEIDDTLKVDRRWQGEFTCKDIRGKRHAFLSTISMTQDHASNILNYIINFTDITTKKIEEERILYLAEHDPLTDLINRQPLYSKLEYACAAAKRNSNKLAVLFIDLDEFKDVNDIHGHAVGDKTLQKVANDLLSLTRESDLVCRLGGDEFIIVLTDIIDDTSYRNIAQSIINIISSTTIIDGIAINISCSIGISIFPDMTGDYLELINNADKAMYFAKQSGKNTFKLFNKDIYHGNTN